MKILIAEDEEVTAALIRGTLAAMGHDAAVATDGLEAWRMLREEPRPLVLSDWMMPGLDGPSLCRRIREAEGSTYTYVILTTVRGGRSDRMAGLRAGADDFLVKPTDPEELAVRLEIARRIIAVQERLQSQNALLAELASTDELTGLYNRREFRRSLEASFAFATRQRLSLSLIVLDVDHFKRFNDSFGHPAGDDALRAFADAVKSACREHEPVARHGGEEFAVLLFGADGDAAGSVAERIRRSLQDQPWPHHPLTASLGIATTGPGVTSPSDLVERADLALYASKRQGRDRVTHFDDLTEVAAGVPAESVG